MTDINTQATTDINFWSERWAGEEGLSRLLIDVALLGAIQGLYAPAGEIFDYCAANPDPSISGGARLARAVFAYARGRDQDALRFAEATLDSSEQEALFGSDARAIAAAAAKRLGLNERALAVARDAPAADPAIVRFLEASAHA